jgi:hypothetical protein
MFSELSYAFLALSAVCLLIVWRDSRRNRLFRR